MIVLLILALKVMNWLPLAMHQDTVRRYDSIEEVRSALNMKDIYVPSYFPQQISWPPSAILAQSKPYLRDRDGIYPRGQKKYRAGHIPVRRQGPGCRTSDRDQGCHGNGKVHDTRQGCRAHRRHMRQMTSPCSGITWIEGKYTMTVLMKSTPFELTKIVESMIH